MTFAEITQLIGSYGFPIICCLYMVHKHNQTIQTMNENTAKTLKTMNETITENTIATNKAVTQLGSLISEFNAFLSTIINNKGENKNG